MYEPKIKSANIEIYICEWFGIQKQKGIFIFVYCTHSIKWPTSNKCQPWISSHPSPLKKTEVYKMSIDYYFFTGLQYLNLLSILWCIFPFSVTIHCFVAKYSNYCNNMYLLTYTCWKWWKLNKHPAPNKHPPHILRNHSWGLKLKEAPRGLIQINMVHKFVF